MYDSPLYPVSNDEVDAFVAAQRHGTLIATPPGGHPQVSILPFVRDGDRIDVHCVQADPTFAAIVESTGQRLAACGPWVRSISSTASSSSRADSSSRPAFPSSVPRFMIATSRPGSSGAFWRYNAIARSVIRVARSTSPRLPMWVACDVSALASATGSLPTCTW